MKRDPLRAALVAFCLLCSFSSSADVVTTESFNFDNNLLPSGWTNYVIPGSPNSNVQIANGQLQIGSNTQAGIYKPIVTTGVTQLKVEYDVSLSPQASPNIAAGASVFLMNNGWFSNRTTGGSVQAGLGTVLPQFGGPGLNSSIIFGAPGQATTYFDNKFTNPPNPPSSNYHVVDIFSNGQISQSFADKVTGTTFYNTTVAAPSFSLSSMQNLYLYGATSSSS